MLLFKETKSEKICIEILETLNHIKIKIDFDLLCLRLDDMSLKVVERVLDTLFLYSKAGVEISCTSKLIQKLEFQELQVDLVLQLIESINESKPLHETMIVELIVSIRKLGAKLIPLLSKLISKAETRLSIIN